MDKIDELLTRGVDKIYPSKEELEKVLRSGKKLRLYQGFDPTGTQLHIGNGVGLRKLRQWQDLGHHVIFLIGDGTGQAGDPSGKKQARERFFERDELRKNAKDFVMQAGKIVRFDGPNPVEILFNGDWLNELKLADILHIAQNFSVQQMIERDMYQERMKRGEPINLREFMYPLLQGYDSVAMKVDLELGGSDQTFNMLAGRTLVKAFLGKEKYVMTVPLLTDANGNKIGKSEGNVIGITDPPEELFGEIMALPDSATINCFTLVTTLPLEEIEQIQKELNEGGNPMIAKKVLAHKIVSELHSLAAADKAQEEFETTFQKGKVSQELIVEVKAGPGKITDRLVEAGILSSKSEAKRLEEQGAIEEIAPNTFRVGKTKFVKFV